MAWATLVPFVTVQSRLGTLFSTLFLGGPLVIVGWQLSRAVRPRASGRSIVVACALSAATLSLALAWMPTAIGGSPGPVGDWLVAVGALAAGAAIAGRAHSSRGPVSVAPATDESVTSYR